MQAGNGFSLVEILVSLLVVSVAAANIAGLQQMIGAQGRDNFIHSAVLKVATTRMDDILQLQLIAELEALNGVKESHSEPQTGTDFSLAWHVTTVNSSYQAGVNARNVILQIDWLDSQGEAQTFSHREQVNLLPLLNVQSSAIANQAAIVESFLGNNEILYFQPNMDYQKGAFVIYNSALFKATSSHVAGSSTPQNIDDPESVAEGWQSYGLINNPALADNPDLEALF